MKRVECDGLAVSAKGSVRRKISLLMEFEKTRKTELYALQDQLLGLSAF